MAEILFDFPVLAPANRVFAAVSTPAGLNAWWSRRCRGIATQGAEHELEFGPGYDWKARVIRCMPDAKPELQMTRADADWLGTRVGWQVTPVGDLTKISFHHAGWPEKNDHFRISACCRAMYLRLLVNWLETGESVPCGKRPEA